MIRNEKPYLNLTLLELKQLKITKEELKIFKDLQSFKVIDYSLL